MFYFLKGTGYPPMQNMTLDDYAKSELIENNCKYISVDINVLHLLFLSTNFLFISLSTLLGMVRILSESMSGPIDMDNLDIGEYRM